MLIFPDARGHFGPGTRLHVRGIPGLDTVGDVQIIGRKHVVAPRDVEVAGQPDKGVYGPLILQPVGMVYRRTCPGHDRRRLRAGKQPGRPDDRFGRNAGNFLGGGGRKAVRQFFEFIETQSPATDKITVVQSFLDDDVGQRKGQGSRGPGPQPEMDIGMAGKRGDQRADLDEFKTFFPGGQQPF